MAYEIIEGISRADIAFRVRGTSLNELFAAGATALASIMLENPESVRQTISAAFVCEADDLDILYYDFLSEFIFYKDAKRLLLLPDRVEIHQTSGGYSCTCTARGETIDRTRHVFTVDIKAVTLHNLSVAENTTGWTATAVVDV